MGNWDQLSPRQHSTPGPSTGVHWWARREGAFGWPSLSLSLNSFEFQLGSSSRPNVNTQGHLAAANNRPYVIQTVSRAYGPGGRDWEESRRQAAQLGRWKIVPHGDTQTCVCSLLGLSLSCQCLSAADATK